eukprot:Skav217394  [mRNA]  locus=scaffold532:473685:474857:- [translate_table: standard]
MTWQCKECQQQNADTQDYCQDCKQHWSKVWHQSRGRRNSRHRQQSQPRSKKEKKEAKPSKEPSESSAPKEDNSWHIFPTKVPWVCSTPQSRMAPVREVVKTQETEDARPLPPPPVLPPPPSAALSTTPPGSEAAQLTEEEQQMLAHLKGLHRLGALPDTLIQQMTLLEHRQNAVMSQRALNHGHLNRLHKARNQVNALTKKISSLDEEWKLFMKEVSEKIQLHATQYQSHRGDLLEGLNQKLTDLEQIKKEVSAASNQLVVQTPVMEPQMNDVDLQQELHKFHLLASSLGAPTPILEISGDEMESDDLGEMDVQDAEGDQDQAERQPGLPEQEDDEPKPPGKSSAALRPFRQPGSPSKVAVHTLKGKAEPDKTKSKEKEKLRSASAYRDD